MAADGTDQRQLTTTAGLDEGPAWSPGGSRIAFTSTRSGTSDIWTMAADGSDQRRLAALAGTQESPGLAGAARGAGGRRAAPLPSVVTAPCPPSRAGPLRITLRWGQGRACGRFAAGARRPHRMLGGVQARCPAAARRSLDRAREGQPPRRGNEAVRPSGSPPALARAWPRSGAPRSRSGSPSATNGRRRTAQRRVTLTRTGATFRKSRR